jgi:hypothetical protein
MASDHRPTNTTTPAVRGVVAFGRCTDERLAGLVGTRAPRTFPVPDHPWSVAGALYEGHVDDDRSHGSALDAAMRGADVVIDVATERLAAFVEDLQRIGIPVWHPAESDRTSADWASLLDALAAGSTTEEAARRCHVSLRSAHRRLATARAVLGVSTNAAAVARWSASGTPGR